MSKEKRKIVAARIREAGDEWNAAMVEAAELGVKVEVTLWTGEAPGKVTAKLTYTQEL